MTLVNSTTHPIFFLFYGLSKLYLFAGDFWAESFAIIAETIIHLRSSHLMFGRALTAATFANLAS